MDSVTNFEINSIIAFQNLLYLSVAFGNKI